MDRLIYYSVCKYGTFPELGSILNPLSLAEYSEKFQGEIFNMLKYALLSTKDI